MAHLRLPISGWRPAVATLVLLSAALSWWPEVDQASATFIDVGLQRSLASFAAARGINAALSFLQGTSVAASPLGLGMNFSLGQVLHPLTQVSEHLSNLLLLASISFGVQNILLAMGGWWPVPAALTVVAIVWVGAFWTRTAAPALTRVLLLLLFVRFAVPGVAAVNEFVFSRFMSAHYSAAQAQLVDVPAQISRIEAAEKPATAQRLRNIATAPISEIKHAYERVGQAVEAAMRKVVELAAIFLLQTVILPVVSLWAMALALRRIAASGFVRQAAVDPVRN